MAGVTSGAVKQHEQCFGLCRSRGRMAKADRFEFNFGRTGDESEHVAVDVRADRSGTKQPCFIDGH